MNHDDLKALLMGLKAGDVPLDAALEALSKPPLEDIGYAVIDHQRGLRNGVPEVIYGEGKTQEQLIGIAGRLLDRGSDLLVTRIGPHAGQALCDAFPGVVYHPMSRLAYRVTEGRPLRGKGTIAVLCAGTSDLPVAEEAAITAEVLGNQVQRIFDVGVAGLHRLLERIDEIRQARVVIVVAGMEGALPSVVGGLVMSPVIAVPTSVGYGANFQGLAALLGMLNSCASGITVVNIDNGFGAAFSASLINGL